MSSIEDKTLLNMLSEIQYNTITLNIIHNNLLVNSQTIVFVREFIEENEYIKKKYDKYLCLSNGKTIFCHIDKSLLDKYKLVKTINDFHYIFEYKVE